MSKPFSKRDKLENTQGPAQVDAKKSEEKIKNKNKNLALARDFLFIFPFFLTILRFFLFAFFVTARTVNPLNPSIGVVWKAFAENSRSTSRCELVDRLFSAKALPAITENRKHTSIEP